MEVIEAQRSRYWRLTDHLHIKQERTFPTQRTPHTYAAFRRVKRDGACAVPFNPSPPCRAQPT